MIIIDFILFYFNVLRVQDSMQIRKDVITLDIYPIAFKVLQNYHYFETTHQSSPYKLPTKNQQRTNQTQTVQCPPSTHKLLSAHQAPAKNQPNTHDVPTKVSKTS